VNELYLEDQHCCYNAQEIQRIYLKNSKTSLKDVYDMRFNARKL
jgi:hypothetical protein